MKYLLLATSLLLTAAPPLQAQTKPASPRIDASVEARANQYFTDLNQRLREVYQAPGDGRAISLLSNLITEFTARKKGLLPELARRDQARPAAKKTVNLSAPPPAWATERQALLTSAAAGKMAARRQRNPALEYAFRHFEQAQLLTLEPFVAGE